MNLITLKQMRYAIAVARTGHFGQAANECAVSQPALSQQIQSLEASCGEPLFDRLKSGVRVTPFGRDFVELAKPVVAASEKLEDFALRRSASPTRPIRFGLIPTIAPYLLPEIFPAMQDALPGLKFTISESRTEALLESLQEGTLDIAMIASEPPTGGPRLTVAPLFADPFVLATPASEASSEPVSLSSLEPERILLLDEGHCFRDQTISACRLEGDRSARTFAATSLSTIVEFVANGQGVTLLPQIAVRKEASDPRIAVHQLQEPTAGRELRLVWRAGAPFAPVFDKIAAVIRATRE